MSKTSIWILIMTLIAVGVGYTLSKGDVDLSKVFSPMSMDPH